MDVWDDDTDRVVPRDDEGAACDAPPIAPPPTLGELLCKEVFGEFCTPWHTLAPTTRAHYEAVAARIVEVERRAHANAIFERDRTIERLEAEIRGYQQARARGRARP